PVSFGLVMAVVLAIVVGVYHLVGDIQLASLIGGGTVLVGCATVVGCGPAVIAVAGGTAAYGGAGVISDMGSADTTALQVQNVSELRANGVMTHLILASTGQSGTPLESVPLEDSLQEYVYCTQVDNGNCNRIDFESRVDTVMGGKPYRLRVFYDNRQVLETSSGSIDAGPTAYRYYLPIKGGKRATVRLNVEGPAGGVWWE
ncbi:MAG: hypothetical protein ABEI97_04045, partial [Candidatus Nanohaloarchaea archaeon]